jgi:hypothetical protein
MDLVGFIDVVLSLGAYPLYKIVYLIFIFVLTGSTTPMAIPYAN